MEVVSAVASVATLTEVVKVAIELQHRFQEAPLNLMKSVRRIQLLGLEMQMLLEIHADFRASDDISEPDKVMLHECYHSIATIKHTLALLTKARPGKRVHWALLGHVRAKDLAIELAQLETSLSLLFSVLQWKTLRSLSHTTQNLSHGITTALEATKHPQIFDCNCRGKHTVGASADGKTTRVHKVTKASSWEICLCNLLRLTCSIVYLRRDRDYTTATSLKVSLISRWMINLEISGWLPEFRIDRTLLSLTYVVPKCDPFMTAVKDGDAVRVRRLLGRYPAGPSYVDEYGVSPLCLAIEGGHTEICMVLLQNGAKINSTFGQDQTSALSWALLNRKLDIVRLLMGKGASLDHVSSLGWSPIFYLWPLDHRQGESSSYLNLLRSQDGFEWLHQSLVDTQGWTLLARCAVFGTPEDTMTLIKYGVDPFQAEPWSKWTVLHYVVHYGVADSYLALFPLFQSRWGIEMPDFSGWTLLHLAIANGSYTIIRHLLENGADWKAETLPSHDNDVPTSIRGMPASSVEVALAYGEERYLQLLDILDEVGALDREDEAEEIWHDALTE